MKKKIKVLVQAKNLMTGARELWEVIVEDYDKDCYYYSPRFKGNEYNWSTYKLIDKLTGLTVTYSSSKNSLMYRYELAYKRYQELINTDYYQERIRDYKQLLKGGEK